MIRYANCWEDADVLCEALLPLHGTRCLSIASAGDNSLALCGEKPELVVAVDISPVQLACTEIRQVCIRHCEYEQCLQFLGFTADRSEKSKKQRRETYNQIKEHLSVRARSFWDDKSQEIENGILYFGKFERYFEIFRKFVMPLIHSKRTVQTLLKEKSLHDRRSFYSGKWDTIRWRLMFRIFFSRFVMGRVGRDPEFFRYVEGSVASRILKRAQHALSELPTHQNPYLQFILTGRFSPALPRYMRPEQFRNIKKAIDSLEVFEGTVEQACARYGIFDRFNMSDIFEYMDKDLFEKCASTLLDHASADSRIVYWNMLVPHSISETFPDRCTTVQPLSDRLHLQDNAFFYQALRVEEVHR